MTFTVFILIYIAITETNDAPEESSHAQLLGAGKCKGVAFLDILEFLGGQICMFIGLAVLVSVRDSIVYSP